MTVTVTTSSKSYTGDGVTDEFPTVFVFNTSDDIEVIERVIATGAETTLTLTTHYTVSGGGGTGLPATGTVTAVSAPASTVQWIILRSITRAQTTALPTSGELNTAAIEKQLDRMTLMAQEVSGSLDRSLVAPKTDSASLDLTLPNSVLRANKVLSFDADGGPTVTSTDSDNVTAAAASAAAAAASAAAVDISASGTNTWTGQNTFKSTTNDANAGPFVNLDRDRGAGNAANSDFLGQFNFKGRNSADEETIFGAISTQISSTTDGAEQGRVYLFTMLGGALAGRASVGNGFIVGSPTGDDKGASSLNAGSLYDDGVLLDPATQAEMEAGSDATIGALVTPGRQHFHPSAAKGWCKFSTTSGTVALVAGGYNVSSVDDDGVGDYGVNWDTDFSSADYAAFGSVHEDTAANQSTVTFDSQAAGSIEVNVRSAAGGAVDADDVFIIAFGDLA